MTLSRRNFIKSIPAIGLAAGSTIAGTEEITKPPALNSGDTVGLITPASPLFETQQIMLEAQEKIENLGFRTRFAGNVRKKWGYLAGSDEERVSDIHEMFRDESVRALFAVRGGYGSGRLLKLLDYGLIAANPKILLGYSDITSLLIGIHCKTGLVTFHGPVAISTFTEYTQKYFYKVLTESRPAGLIDDAPYSENLQTSNRVATIVPGRATGKLIGGNLTLICATLGTPWEIDTRDRILFIEDVNEEPHDLDRYLTHLDNAGKLAQCSGVVFDRMARVGPSDYRPGFNSNLSKEEIITERLAGYGIPCAIGLSLGHVADKPTLPLGIECRFDADAGRLEILESAVV